MKFLTIVLYSAICIFNTNNILAAVNSKAGYYWKDYTGTIPSDAVPGGSDKLHRTTYIGQGYHTNGELMIGEIVPSEGKLIYFFWDKGFTPTGNVKIFCSPYPKRFEWIKTNTTAIRFLTEKHLVLGGVATEWPLLIGRVAKDNQLVVGKVSLSPENEGIAYATVGIADYQKNSYEVLSYNHICSRNTYITMYT